MMGAPMFATIHFMWWSRDRPRYLLLVLCGVDEGMQEGCRRGFTACKGVLPLFSAPQFPMLPSSQAGPYGLSFGIRNLGNLQICPGMSLCLIQSIPFNPQPSAALPGKCFVQRILGCCLPTNEIVDWAVILPRIFGTQTVPGRCGS